MKSPPPTPRQPPSLPPATRWPSWPTALRNQFRRWVLDVIERRVFLLGEPSRSALNKFRPLHFYRGLVHRRFQIVQSEDLEITPGHLICGLAVEKAAPMAKSRKFPHRSEVFQEVNLGDTPNRLNIHRHHLVLGPAFIISFSHSVLLPASMKRCCSHANTSHL